MLLLKIPMVKIGSIVFYFFWYLLTDIKVNSIIQGLSWCELAALIH